MGTSYNTNIVTDGLVAAGMRVSGEVIRERGLRGLIWRVGIMVR